MAEPKRNHEVMTKIHDKNRRSSIQSIEIENYIQLLAYPSFVVSPLVPIETVLLDFMITLSTRT